MGIKGKIFFFQEPTTKICVAFIICQNFTRGRTGDWKDYHLDLRWLAMYMLYACNISSSFITKAPIIQPFLRKENMYLNLVNFLTLMWHNVSHWISTLNKYMTMIFCHQYHLKMTCYLLILGLGQTRLIKHFYKCKYLTFKYKFKYQNLHIQIPIQIWHLTLRTPRDQDVDLVLVTSGKSTWIWSQSFHKHLQSDWCI